MLQQYYDRCAPEFERIYHRNDPGRQDEQAAIATAIEETFMDRRVLEVACGTGYWTEIVAGVARHIVATDTSKEMLAIAREKGSPAQKVELRRGDAYGLESVPGDFDAGLANFWFSHVPKATTDEFLGGFHRRLGPGAIVFMADNVYVAGVGGELVIPPESEDTFKLRELSDGSRHRVLKNYYDGDDLRRILAPRSSDLQVHVGSCFWWVRYTVN